MVGEPKEGLGGGERHENRAIRISTKDSDMGICTVLSEKIICFLEELFEMRLKT